MKNLQKLVLLVLFLVSIIGNALLLLKVKRLEQVDKEQLRIFTEVSDSLEMYRRKNTYY
ncbi:hypothetical protein [Riemerella anatipestifer]|uniref:hypothetical protein n=1 Tax=Riemerella anatipestifer TaxID=34085 RepID=UPI001BDB0B07|nr:hypothetical protein [Riemerella anatipestifer]MBT0550817.1 hypothetical protein [Riemerella anatipestifer]MBT0553469.1 hypothetical protein [Riemerella anatipestifer]MCE3024275.1 hypothetical protein [Riemerella anatipestifer]MCU7559006.1 hypothetical protein [Riemerella anatipestifer]MDY3448855.1 hypothetical protein [Riemerella anatipestifer]